MKRLLLALLSFAIIMTICACTSEEKPIKPIQFSNPTPIQLHISAALGLKEALLDIQKEYEKEHPNVKLVYNLAAAGILASQIEQGATTDIFISAADKQINDLAKKDLINLESKKNIVGNQLVLIVPKDSKLNITSFKDLEKSSVIHFGIGELKTVPAGQYALEVLTKLGIWDKVQDKAVMARNVRQVLSYVETGNAEAGIVFSTVAIISDKVKIVAVAPQDTHTSIFFPGALLKNTKQPKEAQAFFDYLSSPVAIKIFEKYGFEPVK